MPFSLQSIWLPLAALFGAKSDGRLASTLSGRGGLRRSLSVMDEEVSGAPASAPASDLPLRLAAEPLDMERELVVAVQGFAKLAADYQVQLEVAIQPDLTVWADRNALQMVVAASLRTALGRSAGGRVLVGAGRHGGRVRICVLDDGSAVDRAVQEAQLRDAARLIALQGGTLEVNVRKGVGTTVVIRLPEPAAMPASADPAPASVESIVARPALPSIMPAAVE